MVIQTQSLLFEETKEALQTLKSVVKHTDCSLNPYISNEYNANIYLKREDLQIVRSYKIRGAYNKIHGLSDDQKAKGVVCASAGNHAQGVAYSCNLLKMHGIIYMPITTPKQKINQVKFFGNEFVDIVLAGDTFDDAFAQAQKFSNENGKIFIHPFNDEKVIAGQGTVALEILDDLKEKIDYVFVPIGGGGLVSGILSVFKKLSPETKIIGVEPLGAPSMKASIEKGEVVNLETIDKFVDGAAVKEVGKLNFEISKIHLDDVILVIEGKVCTTILKLYNEQAMVVEPAGALSVAALDLYRENIEGKTVVCIVSGSNNDIERTEEIKEKSLLYEGLKHYFMIEFPQRPGALREFVNEVLGERDDITYFQFSKKNSKEMGPAVVGIELKAKDDYNGLINRMEQKNIKYHYLNNQNNLFTLLI